MFGFNIGVVWRGEVYSRSGAGEARTGQRLRAPVRGRVEGGPPAQRHTQRKPGAQLRARVRSCARECVGAWRDACPPSAARSARRVAVARVGA